jgi:hypothetical protein
MTLLYRYKNVKGLGSDMLNEADMANDPQERARRAQLSAQFSGSTAIGSDAYFGRYISMHVYLQKRCFCY